MKKVVVIGGGNGTAKSVVALKKFISELELSAVVSMSDSGGSTGVLREQFETLPPGDIMRAVLAMSKYDYQILKDIFYRNRFKDVGGLSHHNLGNLFLVLAGKNEKDFMTGVRALEQAVDSVGHVYPSTLEQSDLVVELSNGEKVKGEAQIDRPTYDKNLRIVNAELEPSVLANPEAIEMIQNADFVLIAGGSLYTSLVAAVLPEGLPEAIKKSQGKVISIVSKFYEEQGETGPKSVHEYLSELEKYTNCDIDHVLYNDSDLSDEKMKENTEQGWEQYELDEDKLKKYNFIKADLERDIGFAIDPEKLGSELMKIIR